MLCNWIANVGNEFKEGCVLSGEKISLNFVEISQLWNLKVNLKKNILNELNTL